MTSFNPGHDAVVARKVQEDDRQITLVIVKDESEPMILEGGEDFHIMAFVQVEDGELKFEKPWERP